MLLTAFCQEITNAQELRNPAPIGGHPRPRGTYLGSRATWELRAIIAAPMTGKEPVAGLILAGAGACLLRTSAGFGR
jgi:hypothetical protein